MFTQRFIQAQIKKISKLRVTGLCVGNSPLTGEFPAQKASNAENVSIWLRHHEQYISGPANVLRLSDEKYSWKPKLDFSRAWLKFSQHW